MSTHSAPDIDALKAKLKATWTAGDFDQIAKVYAASAAEFVQRLGLKPGEAVLDVACGAGNQSLPAARAGARVTGVDIAPNLVAQAQAYARAASLDIRFDEGDAEALSYPDASFDTVITMFGAMFAPRPDLVARELLRVCRPGGRVVMANWTPEGFIGQMFKTTAAHVPPANMPSPLLWGKEEVVRERLQGESRDISFERRKAQFELPVSPAETVEFFRTHYGPTQKAFGAVEGPARDALRRDLELLWSASNQAPEGQTRVPSEYLEVTAIRA